MGCETSTPKDAAAPRCIVLGEMMPEVGGVPHARFDTCVFPPSFEYEGATLMYIGGHPVSSHPFSFLLLLPHVLTFIGSVISCERSEVFRLPAPGFMPAEPSSRRSSLRLLSSPSLTSNVKNEAGHDVDDEDDTDEDDEGETTPVMSLADSSTSSGVSPADSSVEERERREYEW